MFPYISYNCYIGASHKLFSIEELFAELMKDINKLTSDLLNKEGELSSLSKNAVQSISEFETETDTFIKLLHTARDEQVRCVCSALSSI